ncbi:hypothetical protein [Lichenihabitans psoromatis]|uniref:hypothetical protein n=1 Tax=Lichenihabitans psoromatis TaxID=2528642 RepID=UPI0010369A92|nr:hypothetical protein [Lichenihabitans psoromatis]
MTAFFGRIRHDADAGARHRIEHFDHGAEAHAYVEHFGLQRRTAGERLELAGQLGRAVDRIRHRDEIASPSFVRDACADR